MADSIASLPALPRPQVSSDADDFFDIAKRWQTAEPDGDLNDPNSDSSFLAERGYYRRPHSN